jgi:hypothetical protein
MAPQAGHLRGEVIYCPSIAFKGGPISSNSEPLAMSFSTDDVDTIIAELGASLEPSQYSAFVAAAHAALATCSGPGIAYRILAPLQRQFFDPPAEATGRYEPRHFRRNKPTDLPALGEDDTRGTRAARTRWMRGWRG